MPTLKNFVPRYHPPPCPTARFTPLLCVHPRPPPTLAPTSAQLEREKKRMLALEGGYAAQLAYAKGYSFGARKKGPKSEGPMDRKMFDSSEALLIKAAVDYCTMSGFPWNRLCAKPEPEPKPPNPNPSPSPSLRTRARARARARASEPELEPEPEPEPEPPNSNPSPSPSPSPNLSQACCARPAVRPRLPQPTPPPAYSRGRRMLRDLMVCLVADLDKIDPKTNRPYTVSKTYVRNFLREHKLKPRATAAVDPARARQATAAVRDRSFQTTRTRTRART